MGHTPNRVDRLLIRTATAARAGMATTADISTRVHPANGRGKRIFGSRCHHQHQPWSIPLTDQPILTAHIAGYALAEIGPWLPFEEQEGRLARKSDAAAAHSEWGFQGEHRLRRVDFRDGRWLGR